MEEQIKKINDNLMTLDIKMLPIGLFNGKMGLCIYFYHQARIFSNKKYEDFADGLLENILEQVNSEIPIDLANGLIGISLGIIYLVDSGFSQGRINEVLMDMDAKIFKSYIIDYLDKNTSNDEFANLKVLIDVIIYSYKRIQHGKLSKDDVFIYQNMIISSINKIESISEQVKYFEPYHFSLTDYYLPVYLIILGKIYKMGFYNYKIEKIFDGLANVIKSKYPLSESNRLYLAVAINSFLVDYKSNHELSKHRDILLTQLDVRNTISNEYRNRDIFLNDGIAGFFCIIYMAKLLIESNKTLFTDKVLASNAWDDIGVELNSGLEIGLINGLPGVVLVYQKLINAKNNFCYEV